MSRENFHDTFKQILYFPEIKERSLIIDEHDPLVPREKLNLSRFNSQIANIMRKPKFGNEDG